MTDPDKPDQTVDDADATQPDLDKTGNGTANAAEPGAEDQSSRAKDDSASDEPDADATPEAGDSEEDLDLWAAAMAEQESHEAAESDQNENGTGEEDDLWAAAMSEQTQAESDDAPATRAKQRTPAAADTNAEAAGERLFRPFEQSRQEGEPRDLAMILDIPVRLSVELGRTKVTIKQLLEMAQGSVVELDGLAGEPMDILINGYLIAQGEVVVVEDKYGIRITEIVTPSERVQKLNR
ncbi:MAG: flagellar motor switch protein FliN [Halochromatium sp.]|uniref:flagellar motor switch protein FliN n=1 Tax=Halochromatium sp. TaxID=2049430 RepID=UPI00397E7599